MYKYEDHETRQLFPELFPLGGNLNSENRWVKLAALVPWSKMEEVYQKYFSAGMGRPAKSSRLMVGLIIAKHIECVSDEKVVEEFMENPYVQMFCGYESFVVENNVISPSLLSRLRKRMGREFFAKLEREVLSVLRQEKIIRAHDHMLDATVVPANIEYPTDVKLLNHAREWLCGTIKVMRKKFGVREKVRTVVRKARAVYINFTKKRRKTKRFIRKTHRQMLQFVRRNAAQLKTMLEKYGQDLVLREKKFIAKRLEIVEKIYEQQRQMWKEKTRAVKDRIVSLHRPEIRPIVRGKDGRDVEFGPKVLLSWVDGFCFLDYFSFDAYNEAEHAELSLEKYRERFGKLPKVSIGDGIFGNRHNRERLKALGVRNAFKPLGRPSESGDASQKAWLKKKMTLRGSRMEGIIGHAKNHFGLDKILYRIDGGEEIWVRLGLLGMNLSTALKKS